MTDVRDTDPETSEMAAHSVALRAGSQRAIILEAYADGTALIDEQAAARAEVHPRSCWWKRCSELRQGGYTAWAVDEFGANIHIVSTMGEKCRASVITPKGRRWLYRNKRDEI
jgi:hypothetical protein